MRSEHVHGSTAILGRQKLTGRWRKLMKEAHPPGASLQRFVGIKGDLCAVPAKQLCRNHKKVHWVSMLILIVAIAVTVGPLLAAHASPFVSGESIMRDRYEHVQSCTLVGQFQTEDDANTVRDDYKKRGYRAKTKKDKSGNWVVIVC